MGDRKSGFYSMLPKDGSCMGTMFIPMADGSNRNIPDDS